MTRGTVGHALIIRSLHHALDCRLLGTGCRPLGPDIGIATVGTAIRYPDALVTCAALGGQALTVPGVAVVFKILDATTSRTDRNVQVREHAAVASIRRCVFLESTRMSLAVLERQAPDEAWGETPLTADDRLCMPEIGIEIPVAEFYADVNFTDEAVVGA